MVKTTDKAPSLHIIEETSPDGKHIKFESSSIDELYFKPDDFKIDEKDKIIIDLARENAQLKDCVIELTKKLYCKEAKK